MIRVTLVGPEGPSNALIEDWKKRFPPPSSQAARTSAKASAPKTVKKRSKKGATQSEEEDVNLEDEDA